MNLDVNQTDEELYRKVLGRFQDAEEELDAVMNLYACMPKTAQRFSQQCISFMMDEVMPFEKDPVHIGYFLARTFITQGDPIHWITLSPFASTFFETQVIKQNIRKQDFDPQIYSQSAKDILTVEAVNFIHNAHDAPVAAIQPEIWHYAEENFMLVNKLGISSKSATMNTYIKNLPDKIINIYDAYRKNTPVQ